MDFENIVNLLLFLIYFYHWVIIIIRNPIIPLLDVLNLTIFILPRDDSINNRDLLILSSV